MSDEKPWRINSKLGEIVTGIVLSGLVTFNAWSVTALYARPTSDEVKELVVDKSPYRADRSMVLQTLEDVRRSNIEIKDAITQHTKILAELKAAVGE